MSSILNNKDITRAHIEFINDSLEFTVQITADGVIRDKDVGKEFTITSIIVTKPDWDSSQVGIMLDSIYPIGMFENESLLRNEIEDFVYAYITNIKNKEATHSLM